MGFKCYASGTTIEKQRMVLVPVEVRKVRYVGMFKPNPKEDFLQFGASSEGWEIAKEVPIAESNHKAFTEGLVPKVVSEKEVRYMMPRKKKKEEQYKRPRYEDEDEKGEPEDQE